MGTSVDLLLDRLIAAFDKKRQALEESIQALKVLKTNAAAFPPETVRLVLQSVAEQCDNPPSPGQPSLFPSKILSAAPVPPSESDEEAREAEAEEKDVSPAEARTHFRRIMGFFAATGNREATTAEIRAATGLSRSAVSVILYRTHGKHFVRGPKPGYERTMVWRMGQEAYLMARAEQMRDRHVADLGRLRPK